MQPIYVYIHIACLNQYESILSRFIEQLHESGLYEHITQIRYCILGEYNPSILMDPKIVLRAHSTHMEQYESFTLNCIHEDAQGEDFYVLYMHTKGVTKPGNPYVKSWVEYLTYFNIYRFDECLSLLEDFDTVGVNLQDTAYAKCHYAGNFWWSKTEYIRRLQPCQQTTYFSGEFWLCERKIGNYIGLWQSHCPHYSEMYDESNYKGKLMPYIIPLGDNPGEISAVLDV